MKTHPNTTCPKCHAEPGAPCKNYKGQNCAPHAGRATAAAETTQPAPTTSAHLTLADAIREVLPDLEHYCQSHGPGPDRRLRALVAALAAHDKE